MDYDTLLDTFCFLCRDRLNQCQLVCRYWQKLLTHHSRHLPLRPVYTLDFAPLNEPWWQMFTFELPLQPQSSAGANYGEPSIWRRFSGAHCTPPPMWCRLCSKQVDIPSGASAPNDAAENGETSIATSYFGLRTRMLGTITPVLKRHCRTKHRHLYEAFARSGSAALHSSLQRQFPFVCYIAMEKWRPWKQSGYFLEPAILHICYISNPADILPTFHTFMRDSFIRCGNLTLWDGQGWQVLAEQLSALNFDEQKPALSKSPLFDGAPIFEKFNLDVVDECAAQCGGLLLTTATVGAFYAQLLRWLDVRLLFSYFPLPMSEHLSAIHRAAVFPVHCAHIDIQGPHPEQQLQTVQRRVGASSATTAAATDDLLQFMFSTGAAAPRAQMYSMLRDGDRQRIYCTCLYTETARHSLCVFPHTLTVCQLDSAINHFCSLSDTRMLRGRRVRFYAMTPGEKRWCNRTKCRWQFRFYKRWRAFTTHRQLNEPRPREFVWQNAHTGDTLCVMFDTHFNNLDTLHQCTKDAYFGRCPYDEAFVIEIPPCF